MDKDYQDQLPAFIRPRQLPTETKNIEDVQLKSHAAGGEKVEDLPSPRVRAPRARQSAPRGTARQNVVNEQDSSSGALDMGSESESSPAAIEQEKPQPLAGTEIMLSDMRKLTPEQLLKMAEKYGMENTGSLLRQDIIFAVLKKQAEQGAAVIGGGVLEVLPEGYGFIRFPEENYMAGPGDIYVSPQQVKKLGLRTGDTILGEIRAPRSGERYFSLVKVNSINFEEPAKARHRVNFDNLTPIFPNKKLQLDYDATNGKDLSTRVIDLVAPIGKGQRALIVAPPRTGKTTLMQNIAHAITAHHPDAHLIVLLIDERPEEVTDMARSVKGEVVSSTFDEPAHRHVQLVEFVIEKAKRLVEHKKDVIIVLDSITRMARAYNSVVPSSGKVLSGGVDSNALQRPKRVFGAARNIEQGGSITIIATALVDTGSRMDEVIFEEFKGTGNCDIVLDQAASYKRVYPAININKSGTRKEELLIENKQNLSKMWVLRRIIAPMGTVEGAEFLIDKLRGTKNNQDFFDSMNT